jgi:hypothetical protein
MAMFKSDELAETAVVVFKQMNILGIIPNRLYIVIINDDSGNMEFWITDENGDKIGFRHQVNIRENVSLKAMFEGWAREEKSIIIDQHGKELRDWLSYWKENFHISFKNDSTMERRIQTIAYFSKGFIAMASPMISRRKQLSCLKGLLRCSTLPIRVLMIFKRQKHRHERQPLKLQWKKSEAVLWQCIVVMIFLQQQL